MLYFTTAREIWQNLDERFGQTSCTLLYEIQQSLNEIRQGTDSISAYYTKIKILWDQLNSIDIIPSCIYTNCSCTLTAKMIKSKEDGRLVDFLMKQSDGYEIIRGILLVMSPLPSISHAYRLLM